jgi:hypothetical protein
MYWHPRTLSSCFRPITLGLILLTRCMTSAADTGPPPVPTASKETVVRSKRILLRGCYGKDSSTSGFEQIRAAGFTVIDRAAFRGALDALPPGMKGFVWLGQYKDDCSWEKSDDWIRSHVPAIAGHAKIFAYMIADEPHIWDCPNAPAQFKARSALVKSLDPGPATFAVIEPHSPGNPYAPYVGTVDVIAADAYPCSHAHGCDMSKIETAVRLLDEARAPRYWAIVQAFGDSYYRMPTPEELREEFRHWRRSRMEGYLVFSWAFRGNSLQDHPDLIKVLNEENGR